MFGFRRRWKPAGELALVTGASSGIGAELTRLMLSEGCDCIAVARRGARLEDLAGWAAETQAPGQLFPVVGDVTEEPTRLAALDVAAGHPLGSISVLVNNAGVGGIGRFDEAPEDRFAKMLDVNVLAPAIWIRGFLPQLRQAASSNRRPVICNIGSVLGHRAVPEKSEYSASKFALHGFSDSIRIELAAHGIAVTLVSPSTTRSEFFDSLIGTEGSAKSKSFGSQSSQQVARSTLKAICRRRREVILSLGGNLLVLSDRLIPGILDKIFLCMGR